MKGLKFEVGVTLEAIPTGWRLTVYGPGGVRTAEFSAMPAEHMEGYALHEACHEALCAQAYFEGALKTGLLPEVTP